MTSWRSRRSSGRREAFPHRAHGQQARHHSSSRRQPMRYSPVRLHRRQLPAPPSASRHLALGRGEVAAAGKQRQRAAQAVARRIGAVPALRRALPAAGNALGKWRSRPIGQNAALGGASPGRRARRLPGNSKGLQAALQAQALLATPMYRRCVISQHVAKPTQASWPGLARHSFHRVMNSLLMITTAHLLWSKVSFVGSPGGASGAWISICWGGG